MSEYIKKEDAISKTLIEFVTREENGKVMCACADVKQTCADILDGLPTYSFPDSSEIKGEWIYDKGINNWRCSKCGQTPPPTGYVGKADFMATHYKFCPNCGADMREPKDILHKAIDNTTFAEEVYPNIKEELHKAVDKAESEEK